MADAGGGDGSIWSAIFGGGGTILAIIGIVKAWAKWRVGRISELEGRMDEQDAKIEQARAAADEAKAEASEATRRSDVLADCCIVTVNRIGEHLGPDDVAIRVVKSMLGHEWPDLFRRVFGRDQPPPPVPADMADQLRRLDEID